MLMMTPDPSTLSDALPPLRSYTHLFLPINDATDLDKAEGGSHWTLLLVSLVDGVAFHYDSLTPSNTAPAQAATRKLEQLLNIRLRYLDMEDAPQQENGSDCGVFVCAVMEELLLKRLLKTKQAGTVDMDMGRGRVDARRKRHEMVELIEKLREKAVRTESQSGHGHRYDVQSQSPPRIGPGSSAL